MPGDCRRRLSTATVDGEPDGRQRTLLVALSCQRPWSPPTPWGGYRRLSEASMLGDHSRRVLWTPSIAANNRRGWSPAKVGSDSSYSRLLNIFLEKIMLMSNCAGCGTPFAWERHKKYCSLDCRKEHQWSKKKKSDTAIWQSAPEFEYPEPLRGEQVDPAERFKKMISIFANTGTRYYRLACPRNGASAPYILRWFPVLSGARSFLSANPFEKPDDMPLPGLYVVALFSAEKALIEPPRWKLYVPSFDPQARWHTGTTRP